MAEARRESGTASPAAYLDSRLAALPAPSRNMPTKSSPIGAPTAARTVRAPPATPAPYPRRRACARPSRVVHRPTAIAPAAVPRTPAVLGTPARLEPSSSAVRMVLTALAAIIAAFIRAAARTRGTSMRTTLERCPFSQNA
jgi:hypothetical protein